jgi:hypothetical protein
MIAIIPLLLLSLLSAPPDGGDPSGRGNHPLEKLHAGCWTALGVNTLHDVRYVPEPGGKLIRTIMTAWSGAAYNTDREQLWVHGGGHGDGADNSVYSFDVETLTWTRLFDPSTVVSGHTGRYYLDGHPAAVHSYDYVEYVPSLKRLVIAGARGPYPGTTPHTTVDAVDETGFWMRLNDVPSCVHPAAAVHPDTGILWQHGGEGAGFLASFDALSGGMGGEWISHGDSMTDHLPGPSHSCAIDPVAGLFVMLNVGKWSDGSIWVWDISGGHKAGTIKGTPLAVTGDSTILEHATPGVDWDPVRKKLYAWAGGTAVYEIDVARQVIRSVPLAAGGAVGVAVKTVTEPTPGAVNGTFGRWRYVKKYDVFLGVNNVDEPVRFFKLPDDGAGR